VGWARGRSLALHLAPSSILQIVLRNGIKGNGCGRGSGMIWINPYPANVENKVSS